MALDTEMYRRCPQLSERERFEAVGETIRRGFGPDTDRAKAIAIMKARNRREQEQAGEGEDAHQPTKEDLAIAENEAEHDAFVAEGIAQLVRGRGPQVLAPRTEEQKLRDERLALERRRRAAGW